MAALAKAGAMLNKGKHPAVVRMTWRVDSLPGSCRAWGQGCCGPRSPSLWLPQFSPPSSAAGDWDEAAPVQILVRYIPFPGGARGDGWEVPDSLGVDSRAIPGGPGLVQIRASAAAWFNLIEDLYAQVCLGHEIPAFPSGCSCLIAEESPRTSAEKTCNVAPSKPCKATAIFSNMDYLQLLLLLMVPPHLSCYSNFLKCVFSLQATNYRKLEAIN